MKETSPQLFIRIALEEIANPRDGGSVADDLRGSCQAAISALESYTPDNSNPNGSRQIVSQDIIFRPFLLACSLKNTGATLIALDCLAKLFSYGFWNTHDDPLIGLIIETIAACFVGEASDDRVTTQVIKALSSAVCCDHPNAVHGGLLLKAVRIIYNIFLLAKSPNSQMLAQATLMQIANSVFNRVPSVFDFDAIMATHSDKLETGQSSMNPNSKLRNSRILADKNGKSDEAFDEPTGLNVIEALGERDPLTRHSQDILTDAQQLQKDTVYDQIAKDAYLLFRAFCKLCMKSISGPESATDLKSQAMRSKILSLSLVYMTLKNHSHMFSYPSPSLFTNSIKVSKPADIAFMIAVKQYICLAFTRNVVSIVPQVFDVAMDFFGRMLLNLRGLLKKEISAIFIEIVIPMIESSTPVTYYQRLAMMRSLQRTLDHPEGGKLLVELYLNYDCDANSGPEENIWERFINALAQVMTGSHAESVDGVAPSTFSFGMNNKIADNIPSITTASLTNYTKEQVRQLYLPNGDNAELKKRVLELVVRGVLAPLNNWCKDRIKQSETPKIQNSMIDVDMDDPETFQSSKDKKARLAEGIKLFNMKPKKAIRFLIEGKVIPSKAPRHIAHFLLNCPGLDKTLIGDYLGEGDDASIAIMHAFVDYMDFANKTFVDALRSFLFTFRLPGEAQKIDRFMLKFAERYIQGNPDAFRSADTAYVLAYSVIMLNTDQHNPQVKKRMSCEDFIKNNKGIDEGSNIDPDFLEAIFKEIKENEIKLKDESPLANLGPTELANEKKKKKNAARSATVHSATNADSLLQAMRKNNGAVRDPTALDTKFEGSGNAVFYEATHYQHVKPMFQLIWMSCLMSVSSFLQKYEELDTIITALEGFKYSIHLSCLFELDLEKKGFITNLSKFIELNSLLEVKEKNIEAAKMLLEIAFIDGNHLNENWSTVVKCISQLEKLHAGGLIEPDPTRATEQRKRDAKHIEEMYGNLSSQAVTLSVDRLFTSTSKLTGTAICHFVRALCEMSWDEILSSSDKEHPRMYCLQRLIEISHYNLNSRIRIEWTQIWAVLGPHINQVGCHSNPNVVFFCLDKLRQLASKYLEIEELSNFKFQKDFLRPFQFIFENNPDTQIKDMTLTCINHLLVYKPSRLRSGWTTIFATLASSASEKTESIVKLGFKITNTIQIDYLELVVQYGFYPDFVATLSKFCQNFKFPKINGQAVTSLREAVQKSTQLKIKVPRKGTLKEESVDEDIIEKQWLTTFKNMKHVIISCDLEVRTKALSHLFELMTLHGSTFKVEFWEIIMSEILMPLFDILKDPNARSKQSEEDKAVWISTTLVNVFKLCIELYSSVPTLFTPQFLEPFLDILMVCILQENDTLARLGSSSLQDLIEKNLEKMTHQIWDVIAGGIVNLLSVTTPNELFFDAIDDEPENKTTPFGTPLAKKPKRKEFPKIIVKCVLHLIVIQTIHKILTSNRCNEVYDSFHHRHIYMFGDALYKSYIFARAFNEDLEVRKSLHQMGFMKQLPNLLKQETSSVSAYLTLLSKIYCDNTLKNRSMAKEMENRLIPLSYNLVANFCSFDKTQQSHSINSWLPVMESIVRGFAEYQDDQFESNIAYFYSYFAKLLQFNHIPFLEPLSVIFDRAGSIYMITKPAPFPETINLFLSLENLYATSAGDDSIDQIADELVKSTMELVVTELNDEPAAQLAEDLVSSTMIDTVRQIRRESLLANSADPFQKPIDVDPFAKRVNGDPFPKVNDLDPFGSPLKS
ncbi:hypothetical protein BC833DRAFT_621081 [Globomyces pollinis-pini]|nr:hypothetical protein BC833DRAFT_621081 [Globomyces pollinis-pini]